MEAGPVASLVIGDRDGPLNLTDLNRLVALLPT
jgi:hypothetical protein